MDNKQDPQLKTEFLRLLQEADPDFKDRVNIAQDFAMQLASFTEAWATNPDDIDEQEEALIRYIRSNYAPVAAKDDLELAEAE
jgi:hypothetical protein